jgi:glycopeptide antibiotics resistance protein
MKINKTWIFKEICIIAIYFLVYIICGAEITILTGIINIRINQERTQHVIFKIIDIITDSNKGHAKNEFNERG